MCNSSGYSYKSLIDLLHLEVLDPAVGQQIIRYPHRFLLPLLKPFLEVGFEEVGVVPEPAEGIEYFFLGGAGVVLADCPLQGLQLLLVEVALLSDLVELLRGQFGHQQILQYNQNGITLFIGLFLFSTYLTNNGLQSAKSYRLRLSGRGHTRGAHLQEGRGG